MIPYIHMRRALLSTSRSSASWIIIVIKMQTFPTKLAAAPRPCAVVPGHAAPPAVADLAQRVDECRLKTEAMRVQLEAEVAHWHSQTSRELGFAMRAFVQAEQGACYAVGGGPVSSTTTMGYDDGRRLYFIIITIEKSDHCCDTNSLFKVTRTSRAPVLHI